MNLSEEFREIRRVSTPWVIVKTSDYRATIRTLLAVRINGEDPPPALCWTCTNGTTKLQGDVSSISEAGEPPANMLANALNLPPETILFMVVPDDMTNPQNLWSNPFTTMATAQLRDEFKSDRRTLVILSSDGKLPALIADDVPIIVDPLPDREALTTIANGMVEMAKKKAAEKGMVIDVPADHIEKAISLCQGMTRFSAEEAISRKIKQKRIDLAGLAETQREKIEQSSERGLVFERSKESFADIGGLSQIKRFSDLLFAGERPPTCIVPIEEIEKTMAGSGGNDTSGVSQDQLGVMLTSMEDFGWTGLIAVGHPGGGKSLISKAMSNTHKVPGLTFDPGACKGQYVGQSEAKIRRNMEILRSFAGNGAFFVATSNGIDFIPPALKRRFAFGTWFFDLPTAEERKQIWTINLAKYVLPEQPLPNDDNWTGSDIRNTCDLASRLRCTLIEAATFIVPVAKSDPAAIERLRESASGKYLSATSPGAYVKPTKQGRAMSV